MEEKLLRVTSWLKEIYENQPIPQYEVNAETVDILYELAEYNEAMNRDVSLLIEDMNQQATEYEEKTNYLQGLLEDSLGLSITSLSSEGTSCLNTLAESAMILETKDTSLASFFSAINVMTAELYATESKNREMAQELNKVGEKITEALMLEKKLAEDLKKTEKFLEIEKMKADNRSQNLKFLQDKTDSLKKRIEAAEDQLAAAGLDQLLTHESLVSLSEEVAGLQQEIVQLNKKLESYLDLSPSPALAKVKIEEVKQELNVLEEEFSRQIDLMTCEMVECSKLHST